MCLEGTDCHRDSAPTAESVTISRQGFSSGQSGAHLNAKRALLAFTAHCGPDPARRCSVCRSPNAPEVPSPVKSETKGMRRLPREAYRFIRGKDIVSVHNCFRQAERWSGPEVFAVQAGGRGQGRRSLHSSQNWDCGSKPLAKKAHCFLYACVAGADSRVACTPRQPLVAGSTPFRQGRRSRHLFGSREV